jgi:hypothetical protein
MLFLGQFDVTAVALDIKTGRRCGRPRSRMAKRLRDHQRRSTTTVSSIAASPAVNSACGRLTALDTKTGKICAVVYLPAPGEVGSDTCLPA